MEEAGYMAEAEYIHHIANWHQSSDGRGMKQVPRSRANYKFLNFLLDEWMPWHRDSYDFSRIDINRWVIDKSYVLKMHSGQIYEQKETILW